MSGLVSYIFNTLSTALRELQMDDTKTPPAPYQPSVGDVLAVKDVLFNKLNLPLEIVDFMIDFAEYWPHTSTIRSGDGELKVRAGQHLNENQLVVSPREDSPVFLTNITDKFQLRSYPLGYLPKENDATTCSMLDTDAKDFLTIAPRPWVLPKGFPTTQTEEVISHLTKNSRTRGEFPCRKIVFTIISHDQGWGGQFDLRGTYKGSCTWFEVGHERLVAIPDIQLNDESSPSDETRDTLPGVDLGDLAALPQLAISLGDDSELMTGKQIPRPASNCTFQTLAPKIESRVTAHEPPRTEMWFSHPLMPDNDFIQKNLTATKDSQENIIEWRYDDDTDPESLDAQELDNQGRGTASKTGEYIRNLKIGDVITVWAKARFAMWVNTIEEVKIDIYWAV
jgi:hypothetical protein